MWISSFGLVWLKSDTLSLSKSPVLNPLLMPKTKRKRFRFSLDNSFFMLSIDSIDLIGSTVAFEPRNNPLRPCRFMATSNVKFVCLRLSKLTFKINLK